jgi:hypothetical protein
MIPTVSHATSDACSENGRVAPAVALGTMSVVLFNAASESMDGGSGSKLDPTGCWRRLLQAHLFLALARQRPRSVAGHLLDEFDASEAFR